MLERLTGCRLAKLLWIIERMPGSPSASQLINLFLRGSARPKAAPVVGSETRRHVTRGARQGPPPVMGLATAPNFVAWGRACKEPPGPPPAVTPPVPVGMTRAQGRT